MTRRKLVAVVVATLLVLFTALIMSPGDDVASGPLGTALAYRGDVAWIGTGPAVEYEGATITRAPRGSELYRALADAEPGSAAKALAEGGFGTIVVEVAAARGAADSSFLETIGRAGVYPGYRTIYLESGLVVVEPLVLPAFTQREKAGFARAARQILAGGTPPRLSQFPPRMRAPVPVEVMLALRRSDGSLALWRSARASSVASGLLTTTRVAAERWEARRQNLGPALVDALRDFDVEISLLVDDGTIGTRTSGFLDEAITREHGVAFDDNSSWHYLLPNAPGRVRAGKGSAAFRALFLDNQRSVESLDDATIRLYRVREIPLGIDSASDARRR